MGRQMNIYGVDDRTYMRFKLLSFGNGLTIAKMLKKMVDDYYENDKTTPGKGEQRKMKRFIKKIALRGEK